MAHASPQLDPSTYSLLDSNYAQLSSFQTQVGASFSLLDNALQDIEADIARILEQKQKVEGNNSTNVQELRVMKKNMPNFREQVSAAIEKITGKKETEDNSEDDELDRNQNEEEKSGSAV